jgi:hypothetical protein
MVVAPIAFLRHRRIKPKNRKHGTQLHDEAHGGAPPEMTSFPSKMNDWPSDRFLTRGLIGIHCQLDRLENRGVISRLRPASKSATCASGQLILSVLVDPDASLRLLLTSFGAVDPHFVRVIA